MRKRLCKRCGQEFPASGEQRYCPDCRKAVLQETVVRPRQCVVCGRTFDGGPRAQYCPECRAERARKTVSEYRQRKAAGKVRHIGSVDICPVCGKEYIVNAGLQRYCPDCAPEAVRQKVLPKKRLRSAEHREEIAARVMDLKEGGSICAYCGKPYTSSSPSVTCSEDCAREYKRIIQGMLDYKRGRRKAPPSHRRYDSGLPQSPVPGVAYHRKSGKWQVTHNGKYVGLFETREQAEAKKAELQPPE